MLFALHYAKLFLILLDYASHQKCMPINTAGQNKCLYCRNPYLKAFKHCRGTGASQTRSLKEKRKEECRKPMQWSIRSRASFWVEIRMHWLRVTGTLTLVHGLNNVVPSLTSLSRIYLSRIVEKVPKNLSSYAPDQDEGNKQQCN